MHNCSYFKKNIRENRFAGRIKILTLKVLIFFIKVVKITVKSIITEVEPRHKIGDG